MKDILASFLIDVEIKGPIENGDPIVSKCICKTAKEILDEKDSDSLK